MKSDKIAVLSYGELKEFASPQELLKKSDSEFLKLLNQI
jgi:ABC-type proline/glycine betaine transport system ATPase subunit